MIYIFFLTLYSCLFAANNKPIGVRTLEFFDTARNHPVVVELWYPINDSMECDADRDNDKIWKKVWIYPKEVRDAPLKTSSEKYPLIIMSHGHSGARQDRSWFAEEMVKKGYVVASVEHNGDNWENLDPAYFFRPWDRPLDVSFALDRILQTNAITPFIDENRIGFCGYSLGGMTGLWLAGAIFSNVQKNVAAICGNNIPEFLIDGFFADFNWEKVSASFKDERITSYFLLAPAASIFAEDSLKNISVPVQIVYSEGDRTLPPEAHALYASGHMSRARLTKIQGPASHYVFLNEVSEGGKEILPYWVYQEDPGVDRGKIYRKIVTEAETFFAETL